MAKIHILQHVPFEGPGYIPVWAKRYGHSISHTFLFNNESLPAITELDLLVVLGGPMSVKDEAVFPWLKAEKQFIKECIEARKSLIGICLGAQLIANVLGSEITSNPTKEIGWHTVELTDEGRAIGLFNEAIESSPVFHWHGETFSLPNNSRHLIRSQACENQAFIYEDHVIGLQFHLEATDQSIKELASACRHELKPDTWVQSEPELTAGALNASFANSQLDNVLKYLINIQRNYNC